MEDSKFNQGDEAGLYPNLNEDGQPLPADGGEVLDEYQSELFKIEEEIATLKQVLTAKEQRAAELRKLIGITPLSQLKAELNKVQNTQAYQKTSETLKSATQATASAFTSFGSSMSSKFSEMKNSNTFKSFEEKMEGVGSSIMAKVQGSMTRDRSGSLNGEGGATEDGGTSKTTSGEQEPVVQQPVPTSNNADGDVMPI